MISAVVATAIIMSTISSYFFNIGLYFLVSYKKCAKSMSYKLYSWRARAIGSRQYGKYIYLIISC